MTTIPRHLTQPLLDWLRAQPEAPPALLVTADAVVRVELTPLEPRRREPPKEKEATP